MAQLNFRVQNALAGTFRSMDEVNSAAATVGGWKLGKTAAGQSAELTVGTESNTFTLQSSFPKPNGLITGASPNAWRSVNQYSGTFAATAWSIRVAGRSVNNAFSGTGRARVRVFASVNADGSAARELTTATQVGTTVGPGSTSADVVSVVTWTPATTLTLAGEYIFIAVAWEIITASGNNNADIDLRTGSSGTTTGSNILTSDFGTGAAYTESATISSVTSLSSTEQLNLLLDAIIPQPQNAHLGPFVDKSNNIWTIMHDSAGNLKAYKSTNYGNTWSIESTISAPGDYTSLDCFYDELNQQIYVLTHKILDMSLRVYSFNIGTSTLAQLSSNTSAPLADIDTNSQRPANIVKRSDGTLVIVYQSPKENVGGTDYSRISYVIMQPDGTWGAPTQFDLGVAGNCNLKSIVLGANDRTHIVYSDQSTLFAKHHSVDSSNNLDAAVNIVAVPGGGARYYITYMPTINTLAVFNISGDSHVYRALSQAAPVWTQDSTSFSTTADTSGFNVLYFDGVNKLYAFFRDGTAGLLYFTSYVSNWSTPDQVPPGYSLPTNHTISVGDIGGGSTKIVGMIYGDAGDPAHFIQNSMLNLNYPDLVTIKSTTKISSTEIYTPGAGGTSYTESATISTKTVVSSNELDVRVDSTTISLITTPSSTDLAQYADSAIPSAKTGISSTDITQYIDSGSISSVSLINSTDSLTRSFSDSVTIATTTALTASEQSNLIDSNTLISTSIVSSIESHEIPDSASLSTKTIITAQEASDYVDTSTTKSTTNVSSDETHEIADTGTIGTTTNVSSTDFSAFVESGTITGLTLTTSSDLHTYTDTGTASAVTTISYAELAQYLDSGQASSVTSITASDVISSSGSDSAIVSATTKPSSAEISAFIDSSTTSSKTVIIYIEVPLYTDQDQPSSKTAVSTIDLYTRILLDEATISSATNLTLTEIAGFSDSLTIETVTTIEADEFGGGQTIDTDTINSINSVITQDVPQYVDSALISASSSILSDETKAISDSSIVGSTSELIFVEGATYLDSANLSSTTTLEYSEARSEQDSATVDSTTVLLFADVGAFIDSFLVNTKTLVTSFEGQMNTYIDSSSLSTKTQISYTDVVAYTETNSVISNTEILPSDLFSPIDAANIASTTTPTYSEVGGFVESALLATSTTINGTELQGTGKQDSATISGLTGLTYTERVDYAETAQVVTSTTSPTSSENTAYTDFSTAGIPTTTTLSTEEGFAQTFLDASTVLGTTTVSAEEFYRITIVVLEGVLVVRWNSLIDLRWGSAANRIKKWNWSFNRRWDNQFSLGEKWSKLWTH